MNIRVLKSLSTRPVKGVRRDILSDECTLHTDNLIRREGALVPALEFVPAEELPACPQNVKAAYYSQGNGAIYFVATDGVWRLASGAESCVKVASSLSGEQFFADMYINGFSATTLFNGTDRVIFTDLADEEAEDTEHVFSAGCVHCGRFFGVDASDGVKLWWAASHPLDWTEGICGCGYTFLPPEGGDILALFSYEDRLVAVRRRGITVVRAYGDPQNYKVDATANYLTADGIIARTACACGGKIVFCTRSGLYAFDGGDIQRLMSFGCSRISSPAFAAACGDKYFLCCDDEFLGEGCVMLYDCSDKESAVAAVFPSALFAGDDGVYAVCGTAVGKLCGGGEGVWTSRTLSFGGRCCLRSVQVVCDAPFQLRITADGAERTLSGGECRAVNMCGGSFSFKVTAQGALYSVAAEGEV